MWVLQNSKDCDIRFYLFEGQEYTVGRRDCRILILNDSSVSRNHAKLTVTNPDANQSNPLARPLLTFHDSSKYGSLRNGTKLASGDTPLEDGDLIVFGALNSNKWRVTYEPLVIAFSSLPLAEKKALKLLTRKLGGHVVPEWSKECTYLIMTKLTVTIKVIGALVTGRHIVTPEFLRKIKEAAVAGSAMPDPEDYHPSLAEKAIDGKDVSFQPNAERRTLFVGMTVVFLTPRQLKQLGQTVELAGGKPVLIDEGMTGSEEKLLTDPSTFVMYADPQDHNQNMTQAGRELAARVEVILKRSGLRPIPQSELGLAVLYVSTEVHCNPRVAQAGLTFLHPVAAPSLTQDVLASQTQPTELPGSDAREKKKTLSVSGRQQEKATDVGPVRSSKKRVREEDTSKFCLPSKLPRKEPERPCDNKQPPSHSITEALMKTIVPLKTKGSAVSNASPEVSCVGNPVSKHPSGPKEKRRAVNLASNTESNSINERHSSKQASPSQKSAAAATAGISSQKHSPEGLPEADATNTPKKGNPWSGSDDGDILSPSERSDKKMSRSEGNPNPHKIKRDHVTIEDGDGGAGGRALSQDDDVVASPSGRRDEGVRSGRNQYVRHPHQSKDQSVKKGRDVGEAAGTDSKEDVIPPPRKPNDKDKDTSDCKSVSLAGNSASDPQVMDTIKKEPSEGGTITEDVPPPSGNDDGGRRTWKRETADLVDMDTEDSSLKRDVTEEGRGTKKIKKSRLAEEDHERSNAATNPDDANRPPQEIPAGYITANKNIKCEPSTPLDPTLPYNLAIVEHVDLVIRLARVPQTREKTDAKNFKKFKKASYVGQFSMPHIIGGSDLYHSETRELAELEAAIAAEEKIRKKQQKEKDLTDDLFSWEPRPMKRRR